MARITACETSKLSSNNFVLVFSRPSECDIVCITTAVLPFMNMFIAMFEITMNSITNIPKRRINCILFILKYRWPKNKTLNHNVFKTPMNELK